MIIVVSSPRLNKSTEKTRFCLDTYKICRDTFCAPEAIPLSVLLVGMGGEG